MKLQIRRLPDVVRIHPKRSDVITDLLLLNSLVVLCSDVDSLNGYDCLEKSWYVDDNTNDDDRTNEGENSGENFGRGVVLFVHVRVADC